MTNAMKMIQDDASYSIYFLIYDKDNPANEEDVAAIVADGNLYYNWTQELMNSEFERMKEKYGVSEDDITYVGDVNLNDFTLEHFSE